VTSREEQAALVKLRELLGADLSQVSPEELVEAIKMAELVYDSAPEWSARLLEALHSTGKSWPEIAKMTGVPQTTAFRRLHKRR
jgi:transcriptional regulator of acetoin/glycerol metabolism